MRRLSRLFRRLVLMTLAIFALWFAALATFVVASLRLTDDLAAATDAIVVPTGGRQRLETGVRLLASGKGAKLFISGVNQRVDRTELLRALGPAAEREACCIELGHEADNTFGNAQESAEWMQREGYKSLRLVTSWYHIERGLLEFRRAMPGIVIVAHPVFAPHVDPEGWWGWHGALLLVIDEFHKYLAAWVRPALAAVFAGGSATALSRPGKAAGGTVPESGQ
jgi:uncharacterized SAM-binding protein YcdF (DUF218 family)